MPRTGSRRHRYHARAELLRLPNLSTAERPSTDRRADPYWFLRCRGLAKQYGDRGQQEQRAYTYLYGATRRNLRFSARRRLGGPDLAPRVCTRLREKYPHVGSNGPSRRVAAKSNYNLWLQPSLRDGA